MCTVAMVPMRRWTSAQLPASTIGAGALVDAGFAADERLRSALHNYFAWATTTTMARYHDSADDVPEGLRIPHWSWDGLAE